MLTRRALLEGAGAGTALAATGLALPKIDQAKAEIAGLSTDLPSGVRGEAAMERLPGKQPLIKLTYRPPNYEAPIDYFKTPITPNDKFFVRYHLSDIPEQIDIAKWKLSVGGDGANGSVDLSFADLKKMPAVEVVAVNQCSGNRRGLFQPHVPGVEWGYGAMGCAQWKGAKLKDILAKVGLKADAVEIVVDGADKGAVDKTPDFIKSIPVSKAMEDTTIVAYEMNGAPLPHFNGFPARLVVPGWTGTYWMKHLTSIKAVTKPFEGFWMKAAYRIPRDKFPGVKFASQESIGPNTPITEMVVNSLITSPSNGAKIKGKATVNGIAWDGGSGIKMVEVSGDGGKTWQKATLGKDLGKYAFRPWSAAVAVGKGEQKIMARATNNAGQGQLTELIQNPAGYHHNLYAAVAIIGV
ncbi:MAG: molybdopterin-dependent oxidoreductase [Pseudolabrys sp.]|nr:molybdopterin-dependent oxidoreductase [Pseudolabrys sp.]